MSYGAVAPGPGTSRLFSGEPPSTKQVCVDGDATTFATSLHASLNRTRPGEPTVSPSSSAVTAIRHTGDARYAAPTATPIAPVTIGNAAAPTNIAIADSEPPTAIDAIATPR